MSSLESDPIIKVEGVSVVREGAIVLDDVSVDFHSGFTAIIGPSGAGKSTFASVIHGLQKPTEGSVSHTGINEGSFVNRSMVSESTLGRAVKKLRLETKAERYLAAYRSRYLGYIAQNPYLDPYLTAEQYIKLPQQARGNKLDPEWLDFLIHNLEISKHLGKYAGALSGGEAQRVAIVAGFAHRPELVVADEPTAALDSKMTERTLSLFFDITQYAGTSIICVSHEPNIKNHAERVIELRDGSVIKP